MIITLRMRLTERWLCKCTIQRRPEMKIMHMCRVAHSLLVKASAADTCEQKVRTPGDNLLAGRIDKLWSTTALYFFSWILTASPSH